MSNKVNAIEVRDFFKTADLELAELVLQLGQDTVSTRLESKAEASARMAKARGARGKGKGKGANSVAPANSVPAPAHTAQATGVEADETLANA